MTFTVRLDPNLERRVDLEARRLGITRTEFVRDAIERVLGLKNPVHLLDAVRNRKPLGKPSMSTNVSAEVKARLRDKRAD